MDLRIFKIKFSLRTQLPVQRVSVHVFTHSTTRLKTVSQWDETNGKLSRSPISVLIYDCMALQVSQKEQDIISYSQVVAVRPPCTDLVGSALLSERSYCKIEVTQVHRNILYFLIPNISVSRSRRVFPLQRTDLYHSISLFGRSNVEAAVRMLRIKAVSYTHLTLPTILLV